MRRATLLCFIVLLLAGCTDTASPATDDDSDDGPTMCVQLWLLDTEGWRLDDGTPIAPSSWPISSGLGNVQVGVGLIPVVGTIPTDFIQLNATWWFQNLGKNPLVANPTLAQGVHTSIYFFNGPATIEPGQAYNTSIQRNGGLIPTNPPEPGLTEVWMTGNYIDPNVKWALHVTSTPERPSTIDIRYEC